MKQLSVLLIHRDNDTYRHLTGWWSYAVPEFEWRTLKVKPNNFTADMNFAAKTDLIVLDDWIFGKVIHRAAPLAYVVVDSPRSPAQLKRNREQAKSADLILIDSDELSSFRGLDKPIKRFAYAVNDQLFYPREKVYDVAFLCWPTDSRRVVRDWCGEICRRHNWTFLDGTYEWQAYAQALACARVVVHKAHVEKARSWRVFDVMATRGCLLSSPLPLVSGDDIEDGKHYWTYTDKATLEAALVDLISGGVWRDVADAGHAHVMARHTWRARAAELRATLTEVFRHDPERMALW